MCGYDKNGVKVSDNETAKFELTKDGKEAKDATEKSKFEGESAAIQINTLGGA